MQNFVKFFYNYFWPSPPKKISAQSKSAIRADIHEKDWWSTEYSDKNRQAVDVWVRRVDNQARVANREWFKRYGMVFVKRWALLALFAWMGSWLASGNLWLEVPLTLLGVLSSVFAVFWLWLRTIK